MHIDLIRTAKDCSFKQYSDQYGDFLRSILVTLCKLAKRNKTNYCQITQRDLSDMYGCTQKQIREAVKVLEQYDLIRIDRIRKKEIRPDRAGTLRVGNVYIINDFGILWHATNRIEDSDIDGILCRLKLFYSHETTQGRMLLALADNIIKRIDTDRLLVRCCTDVLQKYMGGMDESDIKECLADLEKWGCIELCQNGLNNLYIYHEPKSFFTMRMLREHAIPAQYLY